jgi:hypothetical protein
MAHSCRVTVWIALSKPNSFLVIFAMSAVTLAAPLREDSTALPLLM